MKKYVVIPVRQTIVFGRLSTALIRKKRLTSTTMRRFPGFICVPLRPFAAGILYFNGAGMSHAPLGRPWLTNAHETDDLFLFCRQR
jgi:hypothetical protein